MCREGEGGSLFVNAATWGFIIIGKLVDPVDVSGLRAASTCLLARAVDLAMRMTGKTIEEALRRARAMEAKGFPQVLRHARQAAATARDAARCFTAHEEAIHTIGAASAGKGIV